MNLNWVDWIIIAVVCYYIWEGWSLGVLRLGTNLVAFLASLWLAIRFHGPVGEFLATKFGIPQMWAGVGGYLVVAFLGEALLAQFLNILIAKFPNHFGKLKINRLLGAALSSVNGLVIVAFMLLVVLALPVKGSAKSDIKSSYLGSRIVVLADKYGGELKSSFDQVTANAVQFLTIEPKSDEKIELSFDQNKLNLVIDTTMEDKMLQLVNSERAKAGVKPLKMDNTIVAVARAHSKDMFVRSYFSHVDPDSHDPGFRMERGGVEYSLAGENIAYAPGLQTAHTGLMNSPGHKANILEPKFKRVGIGIVTAGSYGIMFTQDFAD